MLTLIDIYFVALTVMAEAEGESYRGKVGVAAVIYNRARNPRWWGVTIIDACLTSKQFSAWNDNNPRRNRIGEWNLNDKVFRECMRAAIEAYDSDPTGGADHYFVHDEVMPEWAKDLPVKKIDRHSFIRRELGE
jgi:spore germination cell wall hydrolase CwlJ-like protein